MYSKCRHIMSSGSRCQSPILGGTYYCYFHLRLHRLTGAQAHAGETPLSLPAMEDQGSIRIALAQVLNALGSSKLDSRRAGLLLYGIQIAAQNLKRDPSLFPMAAVPSLTVSPDGEELAPEETACDPPEDCAACEKRDTCDDFED